MRASAEKSQRKVNDENMIGGNRNRPKFSFSYLESISIRPVTDEQRSENLPKNKIG